MEPLTESLHRNFIEKIEKHISRMSNEDAVLMFATWNKSLSFVKTSVTLLILHFSRKAKQNFKFEKIRIFGTNNAWSMVRQIFRYIKARHSRSISEEKFNALHNIPHSGIRSTVKKCVNDIYGRQSRR